MKVLRKQKRTKKPAAVKSFFRSMMSCPTTLIGPTQTIRSFHTHNGGIFVWTNLKRDECASTILYELDRVPYAHLYIDC